MTQLRNSNVLITGAAKGMGREMAFRFAEEGARVLAVDVDADNLEQTTSELEQDGHDVLSYQCDLSELENIDQLKEDVHEDVDTVDVLINNAGVVGGGPVEDVPDEKDELMLKVNIEAVHWMTKRFMKDLQDSDDSHLVQMASASGFIGVPDLAVYGGSKWFVRGYSETIRQELIEHGHEHVGLTVVSPSFVSTGMFEGADSPLLAPFITPEYVVNKIVDAVKNDKTYVREPFMVKTLPTVNGILPKKINDLLINFLGVRDVMKNWTGRE